MNAITDLHADPRPAAPPPAPRRRRRWPFLLGLLGLTMLVLLALAWGAIEAMGQMPVHISIDGEEVVEGLDLASMPVAHKLTVAAVIAFALLAAAVALPVALLTALAGVIAAVLTVVGLPLLMAAAVVAVVLSPLWLIGWLLWRAMRPSSSTIGG